MRIGVPREIKPLEGRIALNPAACMELARQGHEVFVESTAGLASGYADADFKNVGAALCTDPAMLYGSAELIVKVKEPVEPEIGLLRADHTLFSYLHLAANRPLAERLRDIGLTAVAFETVEHGDALPLLAPMSEIAGRLSIQIGAHLLHLPQGGRGVMLGGLASAERGHVVILGGGVAGGAAAAAASAMGAHVTVFDLHRDRLTAMRALGANVTGLYPFSQDIQSALRTADLLIGAVLVTGGKAPRIVNHDMVRTMMPGSVIVDISVDQGGCIETTRPASYADPVYVVDGVLHYCVTNLPGAVPRTASQALCASLIPYVSILARPDWSDNADLVSGINVMAGEYVHPAIRNELT